jgi:hypothetical protein
VGHCLSEFPRVAFTNHVRGCQSLKEMHFPRGGERHCLLVLVSMKAIGLRARAACNEVLCGENDRGWIRQGSRGVEGLATPISLLDRNWRDSCRPAISSSLLAAAYK